MVKRRFAVAFLLTLSLLLAYGVGPAWAQKPDTGTDIQDEGLTDVLLHKLGQGLAESLAEEGRRAWLAEQLDASIYIEDRIALKRVLKTQPELGLDLLKQTGVELEDWSLVDALLPELELYFPIEGDLERWKSKEEIEVAVELGDSEHYVLYSTNGSNMQVDEKYIPVIPTLVLGVSEIDYDDLPSAVKGGTRTAEYIMSQMPEMMALSFDESGLVTKAVDTRYHSYLTYLLVRDDHESVFKGTGEFDFFGSIDGAYQSCFTITGIKEKLMFAYISFPNSYKVSPAIPNSSSSYLTLDVWENDKNRCSHHSKDDHVMYTWISRYYQSNRPCEYGSVCYGGDADVIVEYASP